MGTHPIFESDFDCLTEKMSQSGKSKSALKKLEKEKALLESSWKLADNMYTELWSERWIELKKAILEKQKIIQVYPKGFKLESEDALTVINNIKYEEIEPKEAKNDPTVFTVDKEAIFLFGLLSPASDDNILDMFGFPGYNSVIISHFTAGDFSLTINGSNPNKYQKMKNYLNSNLPREMSDMRITGWDPVKFGVAEAGLYDKILVQAPSSDEKATFSNDIT